MGFLGTAIKSFMKRKTQVGRFVRKYGAPKDFRKFAVEYEELEDLWAECKRPDFMIWMMNALDFAPPDKLRQFACYSARRFSSSMKDPRSLAAIEVAEKFARCEIDWEEVEQVRIGAYKALEEAKGADDVMTETLAWTAASTTKDDALTAAYDTCQYVFKLAEMQKKDVVLLRELQASKLRDLVGNPFKKEEDQKPKEISTGY